MRIRLVVLAAALVALAPLAGPAQEKKGKGPYPGKATWDVKEFNRLFRVVSTSYDDKAKQVTWRLELRNGARTLDFTNELNARPFVFLVYDDDMKELARARLDAKSFKGIPRERIMKPGTKLEAVLDAPPEVDKAAKVVLKRGKPD